MGTTATYLRHATLVVDDLEQACDFYEKELGLEPLPTFNLDFPAQFYRLNDLQQIHVTEWEDSPSFRGHICLQIDDFNAAFYRFKKLGVIDVQPWGNVRRLPDGSMQMFVRDPSGNLVELSCPREVAVDDEIFKDDLVDEGETLYESQRNDPRGTHADDATLYHGPKEEA